MLSMHACVFSCFSCVPFFATSWTVAFQVPLSMGFSRQEYWSGLPCPPQGIFPTQGLNLGLLHCRQILYCWATGEASISGSLMPFVWGCGLLLSCRGNFLLFLLWRRVSKSHVTVWVLVQSNFILWTSTDICDSPDLPITLGRGFYTISRSPLTSSNMPCRSLFPLPEAKPGVCQCPILITNKAKNWEESEILPCL